MFREPGPHKSAFAVGATLTGLPNLLSVNWGPWWTHSGLPWVKPSATHSHSARLQHGQMRRDEDLPTRWGDFAGDQTEQRGLALCFGNGRKCRNMYAMLCIVLHAWSP